MYQSVGSITLQNGETVEAAIITGPEPAWSDRIVKLLAHKGDPWNWQNAEVLTQPLPLEAYFYVLHRDGQPFSNIMALEKAGVGVIGHVWTEPDDRQKGASSALMRIQQEHFAARDGKALYLDTGFGSSAYFIYQKFGFQSIEPNSRHMAWFATSQAKFEAAYFAPGDVEIQALQWSHWPSSEALFAGDFPGLVRCAPLRLMGRCTTEGLFLPLLRQTQWERELDDAASVRMLRNTATNAVVGVAVAAPHPIWPETCLVDIYCHPAYWSQAHDLYVALRPPHADRLMAYAETGFVEKAIFWREHGFQRTAILPNAIATSALKTAYRDVEIFEKR